ncbi:MAG: hypothetical protein AAFX87_21445 [Bacteroidota bacterium]
MLVPFEEMSGNSRVWVYQADRKLTEAEESVIVDKMSQFMEQWAAHGKSLKCALNVFHNQFLVISADESYQNATGCSIDSMVHFVQGLESEIGLNFFDRTKVAFLLNNEVYLESLGNIKQKVEEGLIGEQTLTFNNLVANLDEFDKDWLAPAKNTWLSRYF